MDLFRPGIRGTETATTETAIKVIEPSQAAVL
jgi:hypothetical protein